MLYRLIKKLSNGVYKLERPLVGILVIAVTLLIFINVILRYVFSAPLAGADELSRFIFTWMTFIGASAAIKIKGHVAIDNFTLKMSKKNKNVLGIITNLSILVAILFTIYFGINIIRMISFASLSSINIPLSYLYISLPLSGVFMVIHVLELIADEIMELRAEKEVKSC